MFHPLPKHLRPKKDRRIGSFLVRQIQTCFSFFFSTGSECGYETCQLNHCTGAVLFKNQKTKKLINLNRPTGKVNQVENNILTCPIILFLIWSLKKQMKWIKKCPPHTCLVTPPSCSIKIIIPMSPQYIPTSRSVSTFTALTC